MDRIAVFTREKEIVPFARCNMVDIYEKKEEKWEIVQSDSYSPLRGSTVIEQRKETNQIAHLTENVKAVACKEITGIPFSVFDRKGCCIFFVEGVNDETLNGMLTDIEESNENERQKSEMLANARPVETKTPGVYMLDFKELQKENPDISSKKTLLSFLKDTPFLELHLICEHVPPWLSQDGSYEKKIQSKDGAKYVVVTKKQC